MNIFAIDVGFGTTAVVDNINGHDSSVRSFASRAVPVSYGKRNALTGGVLQERESIVVRVDGIDYEVGPDVADIGAASEVRTLNDSYITSSRYKALLLGALAHCKFDYIDMLVGGLPISNLGRSDELKAMMIGKHKIGNRTIIVKDARVIPQPLGALMHFAKHRAHHEKSDMMAVLARKTWLTADPGYGTFDYLTCNGVVPDDSRSDAHPFGHGRILADCCEYLSQIFGFDINVEVVDKAFRTGSLNVFGHSYDFPGTSGDDISFDVTPIIEKITSDAVDAMKNKVGNGVDIDEILVSGGPAELYLPAIEKAYPKHKVSLIDNHGVAVALGMGEIARQITGALNRKVKVA
ncbi:hypothetical protein [uncultured Photobacterium sp.]|uniref:ParM/StbA family protein n=1 Tax=uncultured Photobacterium sp. TaxID=173973 RepID=UPI00260F515D|nr:hypothetical protein [uncultured Photobacterium sp.]